MFKYWLRSASFGWLFCKILVCLVFIGELYIFFKIPVDICVSSVKVKSPTLADATNKEKKEKDETINQNEHTMTGDDVPIGDDTNLKVQKGNPVVQTKASQNSVTTQVHETDEKSDDKPPEPTPKQNKGKKDVYLPGMVSLKDLEGLNFYITLPENTDLQSVLQKAQALRVNKQGILVDPISGAVFPTTKMDRYTTLNRTIICFKSPSNNDSFVLPQQKLEAVAREINRYSRRRKINRDSLFRIHINTMGNVNKVEIVKREKKL